jgi:predicted permease
LNFSHALLEVIQVTAPIFIIIAAGFFIRKINLINSDGVDVLNRLAYNVGLPALFFLNITEYSLSEIFNIDIIKVIYSTYAAYFAVLLLLAFTVRRSSRTRGAFFVSSYRVNMAFVGLPIVWGAFGGLALAKATLVIAFLVPVNVISSIIVFRIFSRGGKDPGIGRLLKKVATDPIIIATILGIVMSYFDIRLPSAINSSLDIISGMTVAVALLSIGASFKFDHIKSDLKLVSYISFNKLILMPVLAFMAAEYVFRMDTLDRNIIVTLFAAPLAVAAYIMARELRSDHDLVSSSLILTTIISAFTISGWLLVLRYI